MLNHNQCSDWDCYSVIWMCGTVNKANVNASFCLSASLLGTNVVSMNVIHILYKNLNCSHQVNTQKTHLNQFMEIFSFFLRLQEKKKKAAGWTALNNGSLICVVKTVFMKLLVCGVHMRLKQHFFEQCGSRTHCCTLQTLWQMESGDWVGPLTADRYPTGSNLTGWELRLLSKSCVQLLPNQASLIWDTITGVCSQSKGRATLNRPFHNFQVTSRPTAITFLTLSI